MKKIIYFLIVLFLSVNSFSQSNPVANADAKLEKLHKTIYNARGRDITDLEKKRVLCFYYLEAA